MRFFSFLVSSFFFVSIIGLIIGMLVITHYDKDLPDYTWLETYQPPISTRIHAGDGRLLDEFAIEHRIFVPINEIPAHVIHAFLSAEDKNFYSHPGIDITGIIRAMSVNVGRYAAGKRPIGASTVTQQVARNFFLSDEVSYVRKIKEMLLSFRLEHAFTKEKILELYLNQIYLGQRSYGVAAAAMNYFDKSLTELTVEEAAFLAALPKGPNNYHPHRNFEAAMNRRDWVLGRMVEDGYLPESKANMAYRTPIVLAESKGADRTRADYFVEDVRRELIKLYGSEVFYEGGLSVRTTLDPKLQNIAHRALKQGLEDYDERHGWRGPVAHLDDLSRIADLKLIEKEYVLEANQRLAVVHKVIDTKASIQFSDETKSFVPFSTLRWARKALRGGYKGPTINRVQDVLSVGDVVLVKEILPKKGAKAKSAGYALSQFPKVQGAIIALDPHTGRILAMSGGYSYQLSEFNRATQAYRQTGSAFKPFVYMTALNEGFTPSSLVLDAPFTYFQGPGLPIWKPSNYSNQYYGPTPLRIGIEKSRNVMTVRLAHYVGMDKIVKTAADFGITNNLPPMLSMSLGAAETTLLRLTAGYAMIANGGRKIFPSLIDKVQDRHGKVIFKSDLRPCMGCDVDLPDELGEIDDMIAIDYDVPFVPDTREQIFDERVTYQMTSILEGVVQRGTGWRIRELNRHLAGKTGTTNDSMDAWFIGFSPDLAVGVFVGFDEPRTLGDQEGGSRAAAPIFKAFMKDALEGVEDIPFRIPPGLRQIRVSPTTGLPAKPGQRYIWEAFLPGTEPKSAQQQVLDGSGNQDGAVQEPDSSDPFSVFYERAPLTGTGGLY